MGQTQSLTEDSSVLSSSRSPRRATDHEESTRVRSSRREGIEEEEEEENHQSSDFVAAGASRNHRPRRFYGSFQGPITTSATNIVTGNDEGGHGDPGVTVVNSNSSSSNNVPPLRRSSTTSLVSRRRMLLWAENNNNNDSSTTTDNENTADNLINTTVDNENTAETANNAVARGLQPMMRRFRLMKKKQRGSRSSDSGGDGRGSSVQDSTNNSCNSFESEQNSVEEEVERTAFENQKSESLSIDELDEEVHGLNSASNHEGDENTGVIVEQAPLTPTASAYAAVERHHPAHLVQRFPYTDDFNRHPSSSGRPMVIRTTNNSINNSGGVVTFLDRRRSSVCSQGSTSNASSDFLDNDEEYHNQVFYPPVSSDYEWMGRSVESLILGHQARAPILQLIIDNFDLTSIDADYDFYALRRRSTASTFGGSRRRSSAGSFPGSFPGGRRGSLSLTCSSRDGMQGGTMASYYNRRRPVPTDVDRSAPAMPEQQQRQGRRSSTANGLMFRRRSSTASSVVAGSITGSVEPSRLAGGKGGPNVLLKIMARESTGRTISPRNIFESQRLRLMGGKSLFAALDKPAAGMASEVALLAAAIDSGDWAETHSLVARLVVRLIGDPSAPGQLPDPNLPPTAHRYYAGGGRLGLERDAFVLAGGAQVLIRIFREKSFVGQEMAYSYDARDLSEGIVATRLAPCWNEALASLRELVYFIPSLVDGGLILDNGDFLPFLFTLLSHDSCFDGAASLIEEMLSFMSQTQQQPPEDAATDATPSHPAARTVAPSTFYLGNVPNLYKLWRGFNCRQLAHFCRILALLVFEPEDRQLLESPAVLKSIELLQLRRNRAARAGRDSTVDMNQSILLGDEELIKRLLKLLSTMNYAPPLRRFAPYHVMAHFPFVADTLIMLGLGEFDSWDEIDRQDRLARKLLDAEYNPLDETELTLSELGSVADMLESLSSTLVGNSRQPNQIGHIIHVISAAQQAGVIVGRNRNRRAWRQRSNESAVDGDEVSANPDNVAGILSDIVVEGSTVQGLASVAGLLTDQMRVRRLYQSAGNAIDINTDSVGLGELNEGGRSSDAESRYEPRHLINTPEDAANSLQFNAMLFGPYQVEMLFVLCTLLGGRRKLDAQDILHRLGIVSVLDGMFQRLPWWKNHAGEENSDEVNHDAPHQPNGIHGPGCECTPESALCVQYLRMLHNFCDRDCDNYEARRLLLSDDEKRLIFNMNPNVSENVQRGLLSKIIDAFISESDESPYRFWLASCIESFLRGSPAQEQMFVAQSGLLDHLVAEVCSDRLHCAGSLQTSFDLLGELGKGNAEVIRLLVSHLDEESFRKLMSVAAANLVDSNVFIRSLLLSLERLSARDGVLPLYLDYATSHLLPYSWKSPQGPAAMSYLTHSWWDARAMSLPLGESSESFVTDATDDERPYNWFPPRNFVELTTAGISRIALLPSELNESVGYFGWVFTPVGETLSANAYLPNTVDRISWFLAANQARLLRDLLEVVDLRNINHENICCLNTAVIIAIFAHRRKQLAPLLNELRQMSDEEKESTRRAVDADGHDDVVDRAFAQAMRYLDLNQRENPPTYARRASLSSTPAYVAEGSHQIGDRTDVMRNFREVLWFWIEYYTHRGRDRLSLEFSSHIRFQEWKHVVSLLVADDGSSTSLVRSPVRFLPRSPYQRAARVVDSHVRGD